MNKESCLRSLDVICGYLPFVFGCQGTVDMSPPHLTNKKTKSSPVTINQDYDIIL